MTSYRLPSTLGSFLLLALSSQAEASIELSQPTISCTADYMGVDRPTQYPVQIRNSRSHFEISFSAAAEGTAPFAVVYSHQGLIVARLERNARTIGSTTYKESSMITITRDEQSRVILDYGGQRPDGSADSKHSDYVLNCGNQLRF